MFGETGDGEQVQFWPVRPTAARSMRRGDEMLVPTENAPWPQAAMHGRITDIRCDEATGLITINGELILIHPGVSGEFVRWEGWTRGIEVIEAVSRRVEGAGGADGGRSAQRHDLGVGSDGQGC